MSDRQQEGEGSVGYKRPPAKSQFKKGASGNPKGRPKGRTRASGLSKVLNKTVTVAMDGRNIRVPISEALLLRLAQVGLKGNDRVALALIKLGMEAREPKSINKPLSLDPGEVSDEEALCREGLLYFYIDMLAITDGLLSLGALIEDEDGIFKLSTELVNYFGIDESTKFENEKVRLIYDCYTEGKFVPTQSEQKAGSQAFLRRHRESAIS